MNPPNISPGDEVHEYRKQIRTQIPKGWRELDSLELIQSGDRLYNDETKKFELETTEGDKGYFIANKADRCIMAIRKKVDTSNPAEVLQALENAIAEVCDDSTRDDITDAYKRIIGEIES